MVYSIWIICRKSSNSIPQRENRIEYGIDWETDRKWRGKRASGIFWIGWLIETWYFNMAASRHGHQSHKKARVKSVLLERTQHFTMNNDKKEEKYRKRQRQKQQLSAGSWYTKYLSIHLSTLLVYYYYIRPSASPTPFPFTIHNPHTWTYSILFLILQSPFPILQFTCYTFLVSNFEAS